MKTYEFYWSPEGRRLCSIAAATKREARAEFKRRFPAHAKYMGEVYCVVS